MSSLTICNFCSLNWLRERYPNGILTVRLDGWTDFIIKNRLVASFQKLTDHCVCDDD